LFLQKYRTDPSKLSVHRFISTSPSRKDIARRNRSSSGCEIAKSVFRNPPPAAEKKVRPKSSSDLCERCLDRLSCSQLGEKVIARERKPKPERVTTT